MIELLMWGAFGIILFLLLAACIILALVCVNLALGLWKEVRGKV